MSVGTRAPISYVTDSHAAAMCRVYWVVPGCEAESGCSAGLLTPALDATTPITAPPEPAHCGRWECSLPWHRTCGLEAQRCSLSMWSPTCSAGRPYTQPQQIYPDNNLQARVLDQRRSIAAATCHGTLSDVAHHHRINSPSTLTSRHCRDSLQLTTDVQTSEYARLIHQTTLKTCHRSVLKPSGRGSEQRT
jgi:hypothetical protein